MSNIFQNKCDIKFFMLLIFIFFLDSGCKKFIEVDAPVTSVNAGNAYDDDANAISTITGIYAKMSDGDLSFNFSVLSELSADNLRLISSGNPIYAAYYQNSLTARLDSRFWEQLYSYIYTTNASIEGLNAAKKLTPSIKKRLLGEVHFLRAFCYFYLVNAYGNVPLALSTDYTANAKLARTDSGNVYRQIKSDLDEAKSLLDDQFLGADLIKVTQERVRPNRMAVYALLARVLLYTKDYAGAEAAATQVISKTDLFSSAIPLNEIFLKNSRETIWALQPVKNDQNTHEADFYIFRDSGPEDGRPTCISDSLLNSFENGDQRKESWINNMVFSSVNYPCVGKYKVLIGTSEVSEYPIVLRLGEQYLIRAEARNELGNTGGAVEDINVLRTRSRAIPSDLIPDPLPNYSSTLTQSQLRPLILKERRVELFGEWGHRWFDLKRTGNVDSVISTAEAYKGGTWAPYKALYPLPFNEVLLDPALNQNPGYSN